jgi:hypothetical protein
MMKYRSEKHTDHKSMPQIETIRDASKPSEKSIVHEIPKISRVYEGIYRDRPESWYEWESVWTHRIGICKIGSSSDDPEVGEYRCY